MSQNSWPVLQGPICAKTDYTKSDCDNDPVLLITLPTPRANILVPSTSGYRTVLHDWRSRSGTILMSNNLCRRQTVHHYWNNFSHICSPYCKSYTAVVSLLRLISTLLFPFPWSIFLIRKEKNAWLSISHSGFQEPACLKHLPSWSPCCRSNLPKTTTIPILHFCAKPLFTTHKTRELVLTWLGEGHWSRAPLAGIIALTPMCTLLYSKPLTAIITTFDFLSVKPSKFRRPWCVLSSLLLNSLNTFHCPNYPGY